MTAPAKVITWLCHECGRSGQEPNRAIAVAAFQAHWVAAHQEVPF